MSAFPIEEGIFRQGMEIRVTGNQLVWLRSVRRLKVGETVQFVDRDNTLLKASLAQSSHKLLTFAIESETPRGQMNLFTPDVWIGLPSRQHLADLLHIAPQLQLRNINFIQSDHSPGYTQSDEFWAHKERYEQILYQGRVVSEHYLKPNIRFYKDWLEAFEQIVPPLIVATVPVLGRQEGNPTYLTEKASLILGPEGGFSPKEQEKFVQAGAFMLSVGSATLETVVAMPALVFYLRGIMQQSGGHNSAI